jgi:putative membrane protein
VTRPLLLSAGALTLAIVWLGPLPALAPRYFSAHMTMHMGVVAVAAPLLALGVANGRFDPARRAPRLFSAIPASIVELVIVWAWHAPALHQAARHTALGLLAEQGMFLASGLLVWVAAVGGEPDDHNRRASGVVALLLTSMHMTLLGALIALAPRALYAHAPSDALSQQHLGGAIMLLAGGIVYLAGGVWLSARVLLHGPARVQEPRLP